MSYMKNRLMDLYVEYCKGRSVEDIAEESGDDPEVLRRLFEEMDRIE